MKSETLLELVQAAEGLKRERLLRALVRLGALVGKLPLIAPEKEEILALIATVEQELGGEHLTTDIDDALEGVKKLARVGN